MGFGVVKSDHPVKMHELMYSVGVEHLEYWRHFVVHLFHVGKSLYHKQMFYFQSEILWKFGSCLNGDESWLLEDIFLYVGIGVFDGSFVLKGHGDVILSYKKMCLKMLSDNVDRLVSSSEYCSM